MNQPPKFGFYISIALAAFIGLTGCAAPTLDPTPAVPALALVNGVLIDGTGAAPVPDAVLVIQGNRIAAAGPRSEVTIPAGATIMDVGGATILPGFINAHVHFAYNEENLAAWAQGGVTTVRDEGIISTEPITGLLALRDTTGQNPRLARLVSAGYMMTVPNGYGELFVSTPEEARQKTLDEIGWGVDLIKVSLEDGYAGRSGLPKLTDEELLAIVTAAHERGMLVSGHITQARFISPLLAAGVDDIAHVAYDRIPDEVIEQMIAQNTYLVPTFTVFRNYGAPIAACVDNLRRFVAAGGNVALGNDYGGGPGKFELGIPMYEIGQMSKAGMTAMQIIVASTRNAAHVSGIEDELGTLEIGKAADVLVVNGDPLQNLDALQQIRLVIHNGVLIRDENSPVQK